MAAQPSRTEKRSWTVSAAEHGTRLDHFLRRRIVSLSRESIREVIDSGLIRINGKLQKKGDRLAAGDKVNFVGPDTWLADRPLPEPDLAVPVIYEDRDVLVVDKPAGMDTHGFAPWDNGTLANFIVAQRPEIVGVGKSRWEPGLVHRLDRETSGLVVIAKTQPAFHALRAAFHRRKVQKGYQALVHGVPQSEGVIAYPIAHDVRDKRRMEAIVDSSTASEKRKKWGSLTRYRRVGSSGEYSLLEIEMITGVTHQIRVHLAAIRHPIVGDTIYGAGRTNALGFQRHFLHACRIAFHHPQNGRELVLRSPLPKELNAVLERLGLRSFEC
jgi:23S rRNA pseudouridine1911/1915/1917 synthase